MEAEGVEWRWQELNGGGRSEGRWEESKGRWEETERVAECLYRGGLHSHLTLTMVVLSKWNISSRVTSPVFFKSYILKQTTGERGRRKARKREGGGRQGSE